MILCIDDDKLMLKAMESILASTSHKTVCANNLEQAIADMRQETPELIITDYYLRDGHSLDAIAKMKANHPHLKQVPVILISSDNKINQSRFEELNVKDYILKPFSPKSLKEKIEAALKP